MRTSPRWSRALPQTLVLAEALSGARSVAAYQSEVTARSVLQYYMVRSPYGSPELERQRFGQTLDLGVHDLWVQASRGGPQWSFVSRLRFETDFGLDEAELDPSARSRYVPGLQRAPLDLVYAYLEGRKLGRGVLDLRLGRQFVIDSLGWWAFDGLWLSVTPPFHFALEAYGGLEQRGGLPLMSGSRFSPDGVYRGTREGLGANDWPSYLPDSAPAPAWGVALRSDSLRWLLIRVDYRRVLQHDSVPVLLFPAPGERREVFQKARISSERVGGRFELLRTRLGSVSGGAVYDLYLGEWTEQQAALDWYVTGCWTLGTSYAYERPSFDGDSIFNWFAQAGTTELALRSSWTLSDSLVIGSSSGLRRLGTVSASTSGHELSGVSDPGQVTDLVASLSGEHRLAQTTVTGRVTGEARPSAYWLGTDLSLRRLLAGGYCDLLVMLSLHDWHDELKPERDAASFTHVFGGGIHPSPTSRIGVEWEHTVNRLSGHRFRLVATVDLSVLP